MTDNRHSNGHKAATAATPATVVSFVAGVAAVAGGTASEIPDVTYSTPLTELCDVLSLSFKQAVVSNPGETRRHLPGKSIPPFTGTVSRIPGNPPSPTAAPGR